MLWGLLIGIAIGFVLSSISYLLQTKKQKARAQKDNEEHEEEEKQI